MMTTTVENEFDFPEDILKQCVQGMYSSVVAGFDPTGYILNNLFEKGTITMEEKQKIEEVPERRRGAALVDLLLICRRPNAMAQFVKTLYLSEDSAYKWISEEVLKVAKEKVASVHTSSLGSESSSIRMNQESEAFKSMQCHALSQTVNNVTTTEQIRDNYTKIKQCLDPRYDLLDLLYEKRILTHENTNLFAKFQILTSVVGNF